MRSGALRVALVAAALAAAWGAADARAAAVIDGAEVSWDVVDSKWNTYRWSMPVAAYEDVIVESRDHARGHISLDLDGGALRTIDLDGFVKRSFTNVIDGVYDNSHGNSDFVWEVWHIVSQLTVYDEDVHEYSEGRFALETLTRGGGDCEDLVILVADMLMSSEHTGGWTFQYVYMDSGNPTDAQTVNHVILYVDDGERSYHIEATGPPSWDYYPEGVDGWFVDVVPHTDAPDLSGRDFSGMDLSGMDFSSNNWWVSRTDLKWANFSNADLTLADLLGADLQDADLTRADLRGADLYAAFLYGVDLTGADLRGADLRLANLQYADLTGADLSGPQHHTGEGRGDWQLSYHARDGAIPSWADLSWAGLSGADLTPKPVLYYHAVFGLGNADLSGAVLTRANLTWAGLWLVDLSGAVLTRADLRGADLREADLSGADLTRADLRGADLREADLSGADLTRADLTLADLHGADLREADLSGADLTRADLTRADLTLADLYGANLTLADLSGADLSYARLACADLTWADLEGADLTGTHTFGATFDGVPPECRR